MIQNSHNKKGYSITKNILMMAAFILAMILFPMVISYTAEYPAPLKNYYGGKASIYWQIRQITISPVFDEPETALVKIFFHKPDTLFIKAPDQQIFAVGDTIWTYLIQHKQIQKSISAGFFNPFDFIDSSQTLYQVAGSADRQVILKSIEKTTQPDSLEINYAESGAITSAGYKDVNDNKVVLQFVEESFSKLIPADNFHNKTPDGVEIIDLSDE